MFYFALACLGGNACLLFLKQLPSLSWLVLFLIISCLGLIAAPKFLKSSIILLIAFLLSLTWATFSAQQFLKEKIPPELFNQSVTVIGLIDTIPEYKNNQATITLKLEQIHSNNIALNKPYRIRLNWYFPPYTLRVGEKWQLQIRLKEPRYYINPGSFDYQAWLFEQRIVATGYVQANSNNHLISEYRYLKNIDHYRENIANNIQRALNNKPLLGLIQALAVGVRSNITADQWNILRSTGTNHLFAIAGLHIGFVSSFIYFFVSFVWRRLGRLPLHFPTPIVAVLAALLSAILYSALAGFSLPTQRAIIMTAVFLLATLLRKKIPLWHSWSLALILVLIYDPLAVLSASFWMSFAAVALIIYGISGRLYRKNIWRHLFYPQWVISIGLIPICLLFFQQYSLASFIANAIAIPWIGFLILPLSLLGGILSTVSSSLGGLFLIAAEKLLELIWSLLMIITKSTWLQWYIYITNFWVFLTASIAVILLLMPRGIPGRWLGILWAFPLLIWQPAKPKINEIWFSVLNVNTGMVIIIRTDKQVLVYESSIKPFINQTIVMPYLQYIGVKKINNLVINITGATSENNLSLLNLLPVDQVFLNNNLPNVTGKVVQCNHLSQWQLDNITFTISAYSNNQCAVTIQRGNFFSLIADGASLVKTNRISANMLITTYKNNKPNMANVMQTIQPQFLILSTQQLNNSLPTSLNTKIYSTAESGMIKIVLPNDNSLPSISYQPNHQHIWN